MNAAFSVFIFSRFWMLPLSYTFRQHDLFTVKAHNSRSIIPQVSEFDSVKLKHSEESLLRDLDRANLLHALLPGLLLLEKLSLS